VLLGVFPSRGAGFAPGWGAAAALTAGFNVILQCRLVLWQSQQRPLPYAWLQVGASVLNIALSLVGVYLLGLGASGRNGGTALSYLVMAALAVWLLFRASEAHMAFDRKQLAPLVRFGLPLMPHALASVLLGTTDRWMVSGDLGPAALGVYGAVAQLGMVMAILADAFAKAFNPWIYAKLSSPTEVEREAAVGAIYTTIPGFLVAGALLAASIYFAAGWLLGNQFQETRRLIPWFVLGGAFNGIYLCCSGIYFFSGRTGRLALITTSVAAIGVALSFAMVSAAGVDGAAIGYATTQCLLAAATLGVAVGTFKLPWTRPALTLGFAGWRRTGAGR
jgi:O-antigen/teichoic acid export membrane protein